MSGAALFGGAEPDAGVSDWPRLKTWSAPALAMSVVRPVLCVA